MSRHMRFCPTCSNTLERRQVELHDPTERLACSSMECQFVHFENPTPVVAAIVEHEGEIILAHNVAWPADWYALVTGFLERNEIPHEAVLREVKEELNLDGRVESFIGHYAFPRMNQLIIAYHVVATGEIKLNHELDDYKRVPPEEVVPWGAGTGEAVADWLKSRKA
ncbi:MAG: NAD+ diphosphatase [Gammaproteobacteria bacterium]|jgi:NAD+ diphosphatase